MAGKAGFLSFAAEVLRASGKMPARHHELLIETLQEVAEGRQDRLMVQMPPGSAKSTYGSVLFPAYFFGRHPGSQIIATAHTASLAAYFGRHVRGTIAEHGDLLGLQISKVNRSATQFCLNDGGEYFAAGVRGPITGRRADLVIVDDPVKSWADAESPVFRDALYDWYCAELTARLKPGGRIVLIMARWHDDDLAGRLLRGDGNWAQLKLPALAGPDDPLGRLPGAALWPEWEDEAGLDRRRREVGERAFAAIYQQDPRPPGTALFNTANIRIMAELPRVARTIRAWDLAASLPGAGRDPDYTVGLKLGEYGQRELVVMDVIRFQGSPGQVQGRIIETAARDGTGTIVALPQDPGQAGLSQIARFGQELAGYRVEASPETGAKMIRAMPAATYVDCGKIALLAAPWNENFLSELEAFPESRKDDQVDALSRAVNTLALLGGGGGARRLNIPYFER